MPGALLLLVGLMGCTKDGAYDQLTEKDGIDLSMTLAQNGLTLPLGSTNRVMITELLDTAKTKILKIDDSTNTFYVEETGSLDATQVKVRRVEVNINPKMDPKDFALDIQRSWTADEQAVIDAQSADSPIPAFYGHTFTGLAIRDDMSLGDTDGDALGFKFKNDDTDKAIIYLLKADFERDAEIELQLVISQLPSKEQAYNISIKDIRLLVPDYYVLVDAAGIEYPKEGDKYIIPDGNAYKQAGTDKATLNMAQMLLHKIDFGENPLVNDNGHIERDGDIMMYGQIMIDNLEVPGEELRVVGKREGSQHNTVMLKDKIHVAPVVDVDTIIIDNLTGLIQPEIEDMKTNTVFEFDKKMDFLTDERTSFVPKDASIDVDVIYNCPLEATSVLSLTNNYDAQSSIEGISLYPTESGLLHLLFCNYKEDRSNNIYQFTGMNEVVTPLPKDMRINMAIDILPKEVTFGLGRTYNVLADYKYNVILDFYKVNAIYEEMINDPFRDIKDNMKEITDVAIEFEALSSLPLEAVTSIAAHGADGKENSSLLKCENTGSILPGSVAAPTTSKFTLHLKDVDVENIKGLILRITVTGEDTTLHPDQYLEITKMSLTFKNQTFDFND